MIAGKTAEYRRLTRRPWAGMYRAALWMGPDHLLKISSNGYSENYRRYYYQDIQAILVWPTSSWHGWSLVFGALFVLFGVITLDGMGNPTEGGIIACAVLAFFFGALLVVNILRGPSCACSIRTAVQTDKIESVRRLRNALKMLPVLRERILEAQGGFSEADLAAIEALRARQARKEEPAAARSGIVEIEDAEGGDGLAATEAETPEPEAELEHEDGGNGREHAEAVESPREPFMPPSGSQ